MVKVDVLLDGHRVRTGDGLLGFCSLVLVEGQGRTLFDVGHVGRRNALLAALASRELAPGDIDTVVLSHAHWDHAQNLDVFDASRILVHPHERWYAGAPHRNDWATPAWTGAMLEHEASRLVEVEEGYEIEPGLQVIFTPGHSAGSMSVVAETDDGVAVITGDVLHFSTAALTRQNPMVFWNEEQATASIDRVVGIADVIYPGHDRPFRLTASGDVEYLRPFEFTLVNVDPRDPGFSVDQSVPVPMVMPGIEEQQLPPI